MHNSTVNVLQMVTEQKLWLSTNKKSHTVFHLVILDFDFKYLENGDS